jgi:hypothetical protein
MNPITAIHEGPSQSYKPSRPLLPAQNPWDARSSRGHAAMSYSKPASVTGRGLERRLVEFVESGEGVVDGGVEPQAVPKFHRVVVALLAQSGARGVLVDGALL